MNSEVVITCAVTGAADTAAAFYLERVVFSASPDGLTLSLEPEASTSLDARIARLG